MSPLSLRRYRADRLLRRDFYGLRPTVLRSVRRRLASRGIAAEAIDLEPCYAQAWQGLYASVVSGEQIENPVAWLVVVTFRRAVEDLRGVAPAVPLHHAAAGADDPDLAARMDDLARLRQVFEALRGSLSRRECEAASLCYLQGLSRAEAAHRMGISERRMRRLMEGSAERPGVATKVGRLVGVVGRGGWCDAQASLMRGLAFGLLDPAGERHRMAAAHLRDCPACRAYVASLRGLAAALPPVGIPVGAIAAGAGAIAGGGTAVGGAAGGGWLLAGGSLSAKFAAGCLLALGVGAGCVALTSRSPTPDVARAAIAHHNHARAHRAVAHSTPRPSAAAPTSQTAQTTTTGAAAAGAPGRARAHREFGLEGPSGSSQASRAPTSTTTATSALTATSARAPASAPTSSAAAPEPRARAEFGPG